MRRKFVEIEENYPVECSEIVGLIGKLYEVERLVPAVRFNTPEQERVETLRLRARLRDERSRELVSRIRSWALQQQPLPESGLGKAISYMMEMWEGLTAFLDDARIPLDNNAAERALRDVVLGRKNHYGSRSQRGTEVAALFYSLVESAEVCCVEPKAYLLKAALAAIESPGTVTLPHDLTN